MERSLICPVDKIDCPKATADYRSIALEFCLSKIFEKVVHKQIYEHFNSPSLIDPHQSGFRTCHSAESARVKLFHDIKEEMENNQCKILIIFDLTTAFDRVSHERLLKKLQILGFNAVSVKWIESYLPDRKQRVLGRCGVSNSTWLNVEYGVPQG